MTIPLVPPPPLPPELVRWTMRTPAVADVDRLYAMSADIERAVIGRPIASRSEIEHDLTSASVRAQIAQVLVENDGDAACLAWAKQVHHDHLICDLRIHPSVSRDDGDRLAAWGLDWFERLARAIEPRPERIQLGNWTFEEDSERARRLLAHGYEATRLFLRMSRELPADEVWPHDPEGVVVRSAVVRHGDAGFGDARLVHELITTSFADHYNYQAAPLETWFARRTEDAGFDPGLWWIAELDGRPLAAMIMNRELADEDAGYVHYIGVLREGRGRGLAKALLYRGFAASRDSGYRTVKLYVDADSPTGATQLYESIGMTRELTTVEWQKLLT